MHSALRTPSCLIGAALAFVVLSVSACSPKRDNAGEAAADKAAEQSESGGASILNPKGTIDHVQKRLDEATAKDAKRREEMEAQIK